MIQHECNIFHYPIFSIKHYYHIRRLKSLSTHIEGKRILPWSTGETLAVGLYVLNRSSRNVDLLFISLRDCSKNCRPTELLLVACATYPTVLHQPNVISWATHLLSHVRLPFCASRPLSVPLICCPALMHCNVSLGSCDKPNHGTVTSDIEPSCELSGFRRIQKTFGTGHIWFTYIIDT